MHALTIPLPDTPAPRSRAVPTGAADARAPAEPMQPAGREPRADFAAQMPVAEARPAVSSKVTVDAGGVGRPRAAGNQADAGSDATPLAAHAPEADLMATSAPRGLDHMAAVIVAAAPAAKPAPTDGAVTEGADVMLSAPSGSGGGAPGTLSAGAVAAFEAVPSATGRSDPARDAVATGTGTEHKDSIGTAATRVAPTDPRVPTGQLAPQQRTGQPGDAPARGALPGDTGSAPPQAAGGPAPARDAAALPALARDEVKADRAPAIAMRLPDMGVTVTAQRGGGAAPPEPPADSRPSPAPAAPGTRPDTLPGEARATSPGDLAPEPARPGPVPAQGSSESGGRSGMAAAVEAASPGAGVAGQANAAVAPGAPAPVVPPDPVQGANPASVAVSASRQIAAAATAGPQADRIELRLDPPELGRVEIRLEFADDGLRAVVAAERGSTADLLRRHGDVLTQHLREAGFGDVDLGFGSFGGDGRTKDHAQGVDLRAPRPGPAEGEGRDDPLWRAADAFSAGRARSADRAFDMKV